MPLHKPASGVGELRTEYSCRLREPEEFQKKSFRRISSGDVDLIIARPIGMKKTRAQAIRYPREIWDEKTAKKSCKKRGGTFEPVSRLGQVVEKEPWQMTQDEYFESTLVHGLGRRVSIKDIPPKGRESLIRFHQEYIGKAVVEGKPVPQKVLQEYPELIRALRKSKRFPEVSKRTKKVKRVSQPLPPDAQNIHELSFNSDQFTCYGKQTGQRFRAYCRRKQR